MTLLFQKDILIFPFEGIFRKRNVHGSTPRTAAGGPASAGSDLSQSDCRSEGPSSRYCVKVRTGWTAARKKETLQQIRQHFQHNLCQTLDNIISK